MIVPDASLTDQIEFANVILLNKTDMMTRKQVDNVENLVKTLNPSVEPRMTFCTGADAQLSQDSPDAILEGRPRGDHKHEPLRLLHGRLWCWVAPQSEGEHVDGAQGEKRRGADGPEARDARVSRSVCLEMSAPCGTWGISTDIRYGISSFVYSARRPFHPRRLWDMVSAPFCVIQTEYEEDEEGDDEEDDEEGGGAEGDIEMDEEKAKEEALARMEEQKAELDLPARAKCKRESPIWKGVLRSKGFIWLATRPHVHGEWSQAGVSYRVCGACGQSRADGRSCSRSAAVGRGCAACQRTSGPGEGIRRSSMRSSWTLWASGVTVSCEGAHDR